MGLGPDIFLRRAGQRHRALSQSFRLAFAGPNWSPAGALLEVSAFTPVVLALVATLFTRVYRESKYQTSTWIFTKQPTSELRSTSS